jgi:hypothetical protein
MPTAGFSGNGNYNLDVDGAMVRQSGLTSTIYWRVIVNKGNTYGHAAWGNTGSNGWADGNPGRLWTNGNMEYNFQNGTYGGSFLIAEGYFDVGHRADGNAEYYVAGGLNLANLGSASVNTGWRSLPRIQTARVPDAPTPLGVYDITQNHLRYQFSGNGDGGAPILEWQGLWQEGNGPQHEYGWSNGSVILDGIKPATQYNFWSRGRNSVGWGPWSGIMSARTLAGARVKFEGQWREAVPYVKVNGAWKLAQPYSKINGIWRRSV